MANLNKRAVDSLKPRVKDYFVFDDTVSGFAVRVLPSGRKTFLIQYRSGGRTRRVKIGLYGVLTPEEARKKARILLGSVADGANPAESIAMDRGSPTVRDVCNRFLEQHVAIRCKPNTQKEYKRSIKNNVLPVFGSRKIGHITRPDIAQFHHDMRDRPYMANRTLSLLSKMFNLCELWGLRPDGSNPCRLVSKYPEKKRETFLTSEQIAHLGQVLDDYEKETPEIHAAVNAIRLLLLTGCRLTEVQTLKWEYIQGPYIFLPDSKTGARKIPLGPAIRDVLNAIHRIPENPYVITGIVEGHHLTDLQHPWQRIRKRAGLDHVRIHDLRHTYASKALASGFGIEMVGKLLGHTQIQTTMRYAHIEDDPIREAAEKVAFGIGFSLNKHPEPEPPTPTPGSKSGNIVQFPGKKATFSEIAKA